MNVTASDIEAAMARLEGHIRKTPIESAPELGAATGTKVVLKLENTQLTGSFKLRGATNVIRSLVESGSQTGVVAASTGNHGAGVAYAAQRGAVPATVFVPAYLPDAKLAGIQRYGARIERFGDDCVESEAAAREYAHAMGLTFISPYNDPLVVAGQGTVGLELLNQANELDVILVAVGGGGLISGIGTYVKTVSPRTKVVAVSPENSCVMHLSMKAGKPIEQEARDTLSDSTAGGVEADSITFEICRSVVDHSLTVSEAQIAEAIRYILGNHHTLIEGAAGAAVAGLNEASRIYPGARIGIILCGANIPNKTLAQVLKSHEPCFS